MSPARTLIALIGLVGTFWLSACDGETPAPDCIGTDCAITCEIGTQGCGCATGNRCSTGPNGEALMCMDGTCQIPSCLAGDTGCVCQIDGTCQTATDVCQDGYCISNGCLPGQENCACLAGGCDPGLRCQSGALCVSNQGYEGGACLNNGRCHPGLRCDPDLGICGHCEAGSEGCSCTQEDVCGAGLVCSTGLCLSTAQLPPQNPVCYTTCTSDLILDDEIRTCDADGLMAGCLGDLVCERGSCVAPGDPKPTCQNDLECPSFQVCLQGGCYSNCEQTRDCAPGLACHQKACRIPCRSTVGSDNCPADLFCQTQDGENGHCRPLAEPTTEPAPIATSGFTVTKQTLNLSNLRPQDTFQIKLEGLRAENLEVRKLAHVLITADGQIERVAATRDPETGALAACDPVRGECPLAWLELDAGEGASLGPQIEVRARPDCQDTCPVVQVGNAAGGRGVRWTGQLEVVGSTGRSVIELTYVERPEGQWTGTMRYFGRFSDVGVAAWQAQTDRADTRGVENGLLEKWGAFRRGSMDGWDEFLAVLTATDHASWQFGQVAARCVGENSACYPYEGSPTGVRTYVDDQENQPIPTGLTELPIALNLRLANATGSEQLEGRIESRSTLHYPGNPTVNLQLAADPSTASACDPRVTTDCIIPVRNLTADIMMGGRYVPEGSADCAPGYTEKTVPWLPEGFTEHTEVDTASGQSLRRLCMDAVDGNMSRSNPVPDGRPRLRELRLLDGALINQSELFLLFEERFVTFVADDAPAETISTYGYMILQRQPTELASEDFTGTVPTSRATQTQSVLTCSADLLAELGVSSQVSTANAASVVQTILTGRPIANTPPTTNVHYLCEDTGAFNAGNDGQVACPASSEVIYFAVNDPSIGNVDQHTCQQSVQCSPVTSGNTSEPVDFPVECVGGGCQAVLNQWLQNEAVEEPYWYCSNQQQAYCDDDRLNLRAGKTFFKPVDTGVELVPLQPMIADAFRYKTQFRSRTGAQVGFAPEICIPYSNQIPYCYDPAAIEQIAARVDCLLAIYRDDTLYDGLPTSDRDALNAYLRGNFSAHDPLHEGFERLHSELLIMLGDESLTKAFASRFDLAATGGAGFEGERFETGGINLSGVAGFEMVSLYKATQYYQTALDRLYRMGPNLAAAISRGSTGSETNFLSRDTVVLYFDRLIRASTQKARTWSEVAKRYQGFNRPDLARRVVERAYAATYLEGVVLSRLMQDIADDAQFADQAQIRKIIDDAQRTYRMALLDMRDVYRAISDEVTLFGFAPDYIPFPTLDAGNIRDTNAFEVLMLTANRRLDFARAKEDQALASNRSFETDTASFQAELVRVRNNYESQLLPLCGGFNGEDGRLYPAIQKYAASSPETLILGDPCGLVGNGEIHDALGQVDIIRGDLQKAIQSSNNVVERIDIEIERVQEQCNLIFTRANFVYQEQGRQNDLAADVRRSELIKDTARQVFNVAASVSQASPFAAIALGYTAAYTEMIALDAGLDINRMQGEIDDIAAATAKWETEQQCAVAQVDSVARIKEMLLEIKMHDLEMLQASQRLRLALSNVVSLHHRATRLQTEQAETEQLLINVEAARNNPNIRIYRNDAIINADIAFSLAIRSAYRATKVFEYYTSQSYAAMEQLFLIRMIGAGDYNLENYLVELHSAFFEFEEQFGLPNTRVMVLSLKDDMLRIPTKDERGLDLTEAQRQTQLTQQLKDVRLLDKNGYLRIPFSTQLENLSPVTRNHKILYMEANITAEADDDVGRLYLRQVGTGVVRGVEGDKQYFVFPEVTAVINPFFNGGRKFSPEVYRNSRFRDRPLVNTGWELIINQRDEVANQDIDLQSLSDINLYIYYTDFAVF